MLGVNSQHTLIHTILTGAYCMRHDIPIITLKTDNTQELAIKASKDFDKACNEAMFELRTTSFERSHPNQPWYARFNKTKRK